MADWNADLFVKLYSKMSLALGVTPQPENAAPEMKALHRHGPAARSQPGRDAALAGDQGAAFPWAPGPGSRAPLTVPATQKEVMGVATTSKENGGR
jgi:hypothetical protein